MPNYHYEPPVKKKDENAQKKPLWQEMFSFAENGKLKSLTLVYALLLAFAVIFAYFGAQHFLTLWFQELFADQLSLGLMNFVDIALPTLVCTVIACLIHWFIKNKKLFPIAYVMALILEIVAILYILFTFPADLKAELMPPALYMFFLPLLFGAVCVFAVSFFAAKKREKQEA